MPNHCEKCGNVLINGSCQSCSTKSFEDYKKEFVASLVCEKCGKKGRHTNTDEKTRQPLPPILCHECCIERNKHDFYRAKPTADLTNPVDVLDANKRFDVQSKLFNGGQVEYDNDEYLRAIFVEFGAEVYNKAKEAMDKHKALVAEGYTNQQAMKAVTGNLKQSEFQKLCERLM